MICFALIVTLSSLRFAASSDAAVGPLALANNILKTEGPRGLYRGIAPNFMKVRTKAQSTLDVSTQKLRAIPLMLLASSMNTPIHNSRFHLLAFLG